MRNIICVLILVFAVEVHCFAQDINEPAADSEGLTGAVTFGYSHHNSPGQSTNLLFLDFSLDYNLSDWAIGLYLPLSIQTDDFAFPERAYDEFSDFIQILNYARYGYKNETSVYFRVGTLYGGSAKLGHGCIIADYNSDIDFDSPQKGFQFDWDMTSWGFETFVNSITELNLLGSRAFFRPFYRSKSEIYSSITFGVSFVSDLSAPDVLLRDEENNPKFDSDYNLDYTRTNVNFVSYDFEILLYSTNLLKVSTYFDYIQMLEYGNGLHIGLQNEIDIPIFGDILPIEVILEYRSLESDYLPVYFDIFYEIERFCYPLTVSHTTKYRFVPNTKPSTGFYGSLKWGVKELFWVRGCFSYYDNDPLDLKSSAFIEAATETYLEFKLMYAQRNISQFNEILERNEKSAIMANISLPIKLFDGNIVLGFLFKRSWRLNIDNGAYEPVDVYMPYFSYNLDFSND